MAVAEDAREAGTFAQSRDDFVGETGNRAREVTPVERDRYAGKFPVPRWRVFASGSFSGAAATTNRFASPTERRRLPGRQSASLCQSQTEKIRNVQRPFAP